MCPDFGLAPLFFSKSIQNNLKRILKKKSQKKVFCPTLNFSRPGTEKFFVLYAINDYVCVQFDSYALEAENWDIAKNDFV